MMAMLSKNILEKLQKIDKYENQFGDSIYKQTNKSDYPYFSEWVQRNFAQTLDLVDYLGFLGITNGLNFDGLFIYSIDIKDENNIFDANEIFWENEDQKKFLFFGDDSISWFCLDTTNKQYYILDKPSGSIIEFFSTFSEIIDKALASVVPNNI